MGDPIKTTRRELATTTTRQLQQSYRKANVSTQKDDPIKEDIVFHDLITDSCSGDYEFVVEEPSPDLVFVSEVHNTGQVFGPCKVADIVMGIDTIGNPFLVQVTQLQDGRWIQSKRVSFSEAFKRFTMSMDTVASAISAHETTTPASRNRNLVVSGNTDAGGSAFHEMGMVGLRSLMHPTCIFVSSTAHRLFPFAFPMILSYSRCILFLASEQESKHPAH